MHRNIDPATDPNLKVWQEMKPMAVAGLVVLLLGVAALAIGRFSYTTERSVIDLGPIKASVDEQHSVRIPDIAGFAAIAAGVLLIFLSRRST